jgi:hypothetical protein
MAASNSTASKGVCGIFLLIIQRSSLNLWDSDGALAAGVGIRPVLVLFDDDPFVAPAAENRVSGW